MKVTWKLLIAASVSLIACSTPALASSTEILGGGGNAADKLILDWAQSKTTIPASIKFSNTVLSTDLAKLQSGHVDFSIVDSPISDAELTRMNLVQIPFALNSVSIQANLQNTQAGPLKLDSTTLGKIFSGEITSWNDPAITSLNPKHELPNKPIIIIHSGKSSTDYPVINSYLAAINSNWKAGDTPSPRTWPAGAIQTDSLAARITAIKNTPYSISYLPMQYVPLQSITSVLVKNRDGHFPSLSDTSIIAATAGINITDNRAASLSVVNRGGASSWPISNFTFLVISKDRLQDETMSHLLNIIHSGLRFGSLKPTVHNFIPLPDPMAKSIISQLSSYTQSSATAKSGQKSGKESQEAASRRKQEEEQNRLRAEARAASVQDEKSKVDEKNRMAKQLADEQAREQAIREAKAAKLAAEEAIRAANAAKLEAEKLTEKNRQIAKAEKDKADKERAEREKVAHEKAERDKAIQERNQKDEDPLEAYHRSLK